MKISDKGDHENFHERNKLNLTDFIMNFGDFSLLNAACKSVAVRIRPISKHKFWPNIENTLLFSSKSERSYPDFHTENDLNKSEDIDLYDYFKAVKPQYG